ncbi:bifunctional acetate--CoA ligase family protein/GNAT family N-acetyltransferase [Oceaniglobus roseus]|uniref:bifunctional acetate--CoA ligase family protein/GNAT family N-acetyltransferase n=1 Tax=Oceaniglobus roseus TaxID=1737570 RepID=UPI000C7F66B4|nr:bifunctional acetate--CoA ligase family protein/GNAT family N-acetyltransferase [Kandeliimicrobium roseum]
MTQATTHPLAPLFNPKSVAVIGASPREGSVGRMVFEKLVASGFAGPVGAVNPKHDSVLGRPCAANIAGLRPAPDLAVIATPARTVPALIAECAAAGTRHAIVLSAGFGEGGHSTGLAQEVVRVARENGVRLLGPNCVGLVRPWHDFDATFLKAATPKGNLALVSQSGALCSAISDWAGPNDLGFSALVSLGNALDIGFGDAIEFLADDPKTRAILLYVEGVRDGAAFISATRHATRLKPVVVLKGGRGGDAARAAATHTGAMMGSDAVFDAALACAGAVRVETFGQLFAAAEMLAAGRRATGDRLCVVTNGGGAGVLAADRATDLGLHLPPPSAATVAALDRQLSANWSRSNPMDVIGDASAAQFEAAVAAALADPAFDGVLAMLTPQAMTDAGACAQAVIAAAARSPSKPVLACWMGESSVQAARAALSAAGVPDFTTPERAVEAFSFLARHRHNGELAKEVPGPRTRAAGDPDHARALVRRAVAAGRKSLSPAEARTVLADFGIPVLRSVLATEEKDVAALAAGVGFPVALKIQSPDISHKSDVGGVRLGIADGAAAEAAFHEIVAGARRLRPEARIEGVTIEPMARLAHGRELLLGMSRDPVFGDAIAFGLGGTQVELLADTAIALPPLTAVLARRLVERTRAARLLGAFRNLPPADMEAVIETLLQLSDLVTALPEITELDINPLLAGPEGALALDARISVAPEGTAGPHLAIAPYPARLDHLERLDDGATVRIRPIRAEDAESEADFVRTLGAEAKRLRFFGAVQELSPAMLADFTQVDFRRALVLVAFALREGDETQVGVARYALCPDRETCAFGLVVAEDWQRRGVGRRLMQALIAEARRSGLRRMIGTVLRENTGMRDFCRGLGFTETGGEDATVVEMEMDLG